MTSPTDPTHDEGLLEPGAADRALTVILSDTHLAGGPDDPLEDHVWQGRPLARFLDHLAAGEEGTKGEVELILNGDFLEFVQAAPEIYTRNDADLWCSEPESLAKLNVIVDGHREIFSALGRFQARGNAVTVMAGNHDIDLYWPSVRRRLREVAGPVRFELEEEWYSRYDGRLQIAHGHQVDPANCFSSWQDPKKFGGGQPRLENCPGTRFVVGYINRLDERYPFIDNVKPFGRLLDVLGREDKLGTFWALVWFAGFVGRDGGALLGGDAEEDPVERLLATLGDDPDFADEVLPIYREVRGEATRREMQDRLASRPELDAFVDEVLQAGRLVDLPSPPPASTLGGGYGDQVEAEDGGLLGLIRERRTDVVQDLRDAAAERAEKHGAEVIVCGHTHVPEEVKASGHVYFNTGSWTRYLRLGVEDEITLDALRDGDAFPYELWAVFVRPGDGGGLEASRELFEKG